jgi:hypothetical protein
MLIDIVLSGLYRKLFEVIPNKTSVHENLRFRHKLIMVIAPQNNFSPRLTVHVLRAPVKLEIFLIKKSNDISIIA